MVTIVTAGDTLAGPPTWEVLVPAQVTFVTLLVPRTLLKNPFELWPRVTVPVMVMPPSMRKDEFCKTVMLPAQLEDVALPVPSSMLLCTCTCPVPMMSSALGAKNAASGPVNS